MSGEILLSATPLGRRAALIEDGAVSAFMIESALRPSRVGDLHLGRVARVAPALGGGFVALGDGAGEGWLESATSLAPGQSVMVQIMSDARGAKGPRLGLATSDAADAARDVVSDAADAARDVVSGAADAARDAAWPAIEAACRAGGEPRRLWSTGGLLGRLLRDHVGRETRLVIDDKATFEQTRRLAEARVPAFAACLELADGELDLFERHDAQGVFEAARAPLVPFEGGRLVIESTEALTAIDIDVFGASPADLARRAVGVSAVEIRRRNLGGLIVLDPPRFKAAKARAALIEALRAGLDTDRAIHHVHGVSAAGLIELTRQRIGESIEEALSESAGPGAPRTPRLDALGHDLLLGARRAVRAGARRLVIRAAPALLGVIDAAPGLAGDGLARWLCRGIERRPEPDRAPSRFEIEAL